MTSSPFPCVLEQTVASALLQLSSSPPSPSLSPSKHCMEIASSEEENIDSSSTSLLLSTESRSCTSSLTSTVASDEVRTRKIRVIAGNVRRRRGLKLKVTRRTRSKLVRKCKQQNVKASKTASLSSGFRFGFGSAKTVSCLSSSSSEDSSAQSHGSSTSKVKNKRAKVPGASSHMRRRAEAILEFLSSGCAKEFTIRQVLGDSPDTSKALRMLLRSDKVRRSGTGGRHDPYVYVDLYLKYKDKKEKQLKLLQKTKKGN